MMRCSMSIAEATTRDHDRTRNAISAQVSGLRQATNPNTTAVAASMIG